MSLVYHNFLCQEKGYIVVAKVFITLISENILEGENILSQILIIQHCKTVHCVCWRQTNKINILINFEFKKSVQT